MGYQKSTRSSSAKSKLQDSITSPSPVRSFMNRVPKAAKTTPTSPSMSATTSGSNMTESLIRTGYRKYTLEQISWLLVHGAQVMEEKNTWECLTDEFNTRYGVQKSPQTLKTYYKRQDALQMSVGTPLAPGRLRSSVSPPEAKITAASGIYNKKQRPTRTTRQKKEISTEGFHSSFSGSRVKKAKKGEMGPQRARSESQMSDSITVRSTHTERGIPFVATDKKEIDLVNDESMSESSVVSTEENISDEGKSQGVIPVGEGRESSPFTDVGVGEDASQSGDSEYQVDGGGQESDGESVASDESQESDSQESDSQESDSQGNDSDVETATGSGGDSAGSGTGKRHKGLPGYEVIIDNSSANRKGAPANEYTMIEEDTIGSRAASVALPNDKIPTDHEGGISATTRTIDDYLKKKALGQATMSTTDGIFTLEQGDTSPPGSSSPTISAQRHYPDQSTDNRNTTQNIHTPPPLPMHDQVAIGRGGHKPLPSINSSKLFTHTEQLSGPQQQYELVESDSEDYEEPPAITDPIDSTSMKWASHASPGPSYTKGSCTSSPGSYGGVGWSVSRTSGDGGRKAAQGSTLSIFGAQSTQKRIDRARSLEQEISHRRLMNTEIPGRDYPSSPVNEPAQDAPIPIFFGTRIPKRVMGLDQGRSDRITSAYGAPLLSKFGSSSTLTAQYSMDGTASTPPKATRSEQGVWEPSGSHKKRRATRGLPPFNSGDGGLHKGLGGDSGTVGEDGSRSASTTKTITGGGMPVAEQYEDILTKYTHQYTDTGDVIVSGEQRLINHKDSISKKAAEATLEGSLKRPHEEGTPLAPIKAMGSPIKKAKLSMSGGSKAPDREQFKPMISKTMGIKKMGTVNGNGIVRIYLDRGAIGISEPSVVPGPISWGRTPEHGPGELNQVITGELRELFYAMKAAGDHKNVTIYTASQSAIDWVESNYIHARRTQWRTSWGADVPMVDQMLIEDVVEMIAKRNASNKVTVFKRVWGGKKVYENLILEAQREWESAQVDEEMEGA